MVGLVSYFANAFNHNETSWEHYQVMLFSIPTMPFVEFFMAGRGRFPLQ